MMVRKGTGRFKRADNSRLWGPEIEMIFCQQFSRLLWELNRAGSEWSGSCIGGEPSWQIEGYCRVCWSVLLGQCCQFEMYSLFDWKPVQLFQKRCSMISAFLFEDELSCIVLDTLIAGYLFWGGASKKGIAIVQSVQNARAAKLSSDLFSLKWSDNAQPTNFKIGHATQLLTLIQQNCWEPVYFENMHCKKNSMI